MSAYLDEKTVSLLNIIDLLFPVYQRLHQTEPDNKTAWDITLVRILFYFTGLDWNI